jgi:hypothetical protein
MQFVCYSPRCLPLSPIHPADRALLFPVDKWTVEIFNLLKCITLRIRRSELCGEMIKLLIYGD